MSQNPQSNQASQASLPGRILIVDDDGAVAKAIEEPLNTRYKVRVDKATNLETALYLFNTQRFEAVLIELDFAPLAGLALVQKWRNHDIHEKRQASFIMMSGNKSLGANEGLIKEIGDLEILVKPFSVIQLLPYLSRAMALKRRQTAYAEVKSRIVDFYEKTGDFDKAAQQVQKKLPELGPRGLNLLCDLYEKGGRFDEALNIINPMLVQNPQNITLLNAKGRLLMRLGRFSEAKAALVMSDQLAPQNIERLNQLALASLQLKDPKASVGYFKQLVNLSPEQPDLKFDMFSKLYEHGFDEEAVAFGKETAKPMEIVRHYNNKGVLLSKEGDVPQALTEYQRALGFFPQFKENYRIYYNIALAKLQSKSRESYEEAAKNLKRCLELSPGFEKAQNTLDKIEKALTGKKVDPAA